MGGNSGGAAGENGLDSFLAKGDPWDEPRDFGHWGGAGGEAGYDAAMSKQRANRERWEAQKPIWDFLKSKNPDWFKKPGPGEGDEGGDPYTVPVARNPLEFAYYKPMAPAPGGGAPDVYNPMAPAPGGGPTNWKPGAGNLGGYHLGPGMPGMPGWPGGGVASLKSGTMRGGSITPSNYMGPRPLTQTRMFANGGPVDQAAAFGYPSVGAQPMPGSFLPDNSDRHAHMQPIGRPMGPPAGGYYNPIAQQPPMTMQPQAISTTRGFAGGGLTDSLNLGGYHLGPGMPGGNLGGYGINPGFGGGAATGGSGTASPAPAPTTVPVATRNPLMMAGATAPGGGATNWKPTPGGGAPDVYNPMAPAPGGPPGGGNLGGYHLGPKGPIGGAVTGGSGTVGSGSTVAPDGLGGIASLPGAIGGGATRPSPIYSGGPAPAPGGGLPPPMPGPVPRPGGGYTNGRTPGGGGPDYPPGYGPGAGNLGGYHLGPRFPGRSLGGYGRNPGFSGGYGRPTMPDGRYNNGRVPAPMPSGLASLTGNMFRR